MQKNLKRASAMILSLAMAVQFGLTDSYYINANDEQPVEETKQAETTKVDESKNEPKTPQADSSEDNQAQTDDVNKEENPQSQDETTTTEKVTVEISYVTEEDGSTLMDSLTNTYDVGYRLDQDSNVFNTNHEEYVLDYAIINNDEGNKITKDQASENGLCVASGMTSVKFVYKKSTVQKSHKAKKAQGTKMDSKGEDDSEDDIETASDSETYKLYHYALIPGKLMDSTESADSRWFGIGVTSISGVSNPSGLEYGIQSNFTYKQEGVVKTLYPDITYNSKTYKYAATGSENADKEGYYTLIPARVMIADGANAGNNSYNPTASGKTYHQDYTIVMNEKNIYTVTYNVMDPGETTYGVLNDYSQRVDAGTSESKLKQPASEDVPNVKTDSEGNKYTFSGWYKDQECTVKANFNGSVTANTNYYGKYVAETYTVKYDSNGGSAVADKTLKYNDVVDTSETPTKEGYIFDGWYYGDTKVTKQKYATLAKSESTKEITLKAKWETDLSATSEDVSKTYDGNGYGIEVKPNKTGATIKYYNEKTNQYDLTKCPTQKNVGSKTVKYEVSKKGYTTFTGQATVRITPATLTVTTPSKSKVYDGEALTAEGSIEGFVNNETATFTTTGSQTNVGSSDNTYSLKFDGTAKESNYVISEKEIGKLTVTESTEEITVTTTGGEFTYNGQAHGATVSVSKLPKGYTVETATSSATATDVTETPVTATCDTLVIRNAAGEDVTSKLNVKKVDGSITITPATLKVTTPSKSKTYDGTALTAEGSIEGFVNGETATFTTTGSQTNVGSSDNTYEISWNGTAKQSNYTVSENLGTLLVSEYAEEITVTTTGGTSTYDGQPHGATVTVSELPTGYTLEKAESSASVTEVTKESVAATCDTLVIRNAAGEDVTSKLNVKKVDGSITITPATLKVTTPSKSKTYDGTALTAEGSIEGFVNGETATFTTTGSQTKVGSSENTYEITWNGTAKKSNYTVSAAKGQLTVNPKTVTVKADNKTKVYGTTDPELTATVTGTIGDDKISYTLSRAKGESVGNHAINVTGDMTQGNYKVEYAPGTLTITRQSIVPDPENPDSYKGVTVNSPNDKEYNGKDQTWVSEVKDADGKALGSSDYKVSYDKEDRKNVTGTITVTITGTGNYTGTVTRTYQITPRSIKLTSDDGSKVYDGTPLKKPNVTVTGEFVDGEVTNVKAIGSVTEAGKSVKNTIAYTTHSNKGFKESNYKIEKFEGTLTITRQSIVPNPENPDSYKGVTVNTPKDVEYDGKEHKWSPVVTTKSGEKLEAGKDYEVAYSTEDFTNVGTIKVTIKGIGNYSGTVKRSYKVTPKEYTVTTDSATKTYSGTALTAGGKVEGIVSGEEVIITTTGSQTEVGTSKNTYTLEWKSAVETNYTLAKESIGDLTVKAKSIVPDDSDKTGITVSEPSDSKYDGKEHKEVLTVTDTKTSKELVAGTDYSVTYSSDLVNAGTVTIKVAGLGNYTGSFTKTYKITKRSVTLTSATVSKVYDGSALTDTTIDVSGDGFVEGEGASYEVTGTQTEVGNSANAFEYKLNENTLASNYDITKVVGTLTITAAPTPVTPSNPTTPTTPTNPGTTNTSRITGTTTTQTRTPSTPTTTPSEASKDATDKVKKEKTPKEEKVEESATPKAKPESFWALINLICAIVTALFGLLLLISKRHKSEDEDDEEDETMDEESKEQEKKRGLFTRVLAVLITILSIVFFLITEDMSLPWTWTDQYTIWMVVIGVVQIVVFFVGRKWKNVDDDDDSEE